MIDLSECNCDHDIIIVNIMQIEEPEDRSGQAEVRHPKPTEV